MKIIHGIYHLFDVLEDKIRGTLSHYPLIYTFLGGSGIVLFWRGVWHTADILEYSGGWLAILFSPLGSMVLGIMILLGTGLFVSMFIGDSIIISGLNRDKKRFEKAMDGVKEDVKSAKEVSQKMKADVKVAKEMSKEIKENVNEVKEVSKEVKQDVKNVKEEISEKI